MTSMTLVLLRSKCSKKREKFRGMKKNGGEAEISENESQVQSIERTTASERL